MNRSGSSLASFLPPHSFVMGRREDQKPQNDPTGETLVFVAEATPHGPSGFAGSAEGMLFRRILEAMKVPLDQAVLVFHEDPGLWDRIREHGPATVVFFGVGALREEVHEHAGIRAIVTESLSAMLAEPSRKKAAWEDLKRVIAGQPNDTKRQ